MLTYSNYLKSWKLYKWFKNGRQQTRTTRVARPSGWPAQNVRETTTTVSWLKGALSQKQVRKQQKNFTIRLLF